MNLRLVVHIIVVLLVTEPLLAEVARTPRGGKVKVILRQASALYEKPDLSARSRPAAQMEFFYVLQPPKGTELTDKGFYRVSASSSDSDFQGYIPADHCVVWTHRQALMLLPRTHREPALFYAAEKDVRAAYDGSRPGPDPISREPRGTVGRSVIPILNVSEMKLAGDTFKVFEVAYLHSLAGIGSKSPTPGAESTKLINLSKATLDVVFVIDCTASMEPHMRALKQVVAKVVGDIRQRHLNDRMADKTPFDSVDGKVLEPRGIIRTASIRANTDQVDTVDAESPKHRAPNVRFGLVGYRDAISVSDPSWFLTKLFCDLEAGQDHDAFMACLDTVRESPLGSEDTQEDVLAGLAVAIKESKWNPDAFKHIVLIGDASCHLEESGQKNPGRNTIPGVVAMAQPRGNENIGLNIALHAIRIVGGDPTDHARCDKQFRAIADGANFPGFYRVFESNAQTAFVDELSKLILRSRQGLHDGLHGTLPSTDTPGWAMVLEMMNASQSDNVIEFAKGYVAEVDPDQNQCFDPAVLVEYGAIARFASGIHFITTALRSGGPSGKRTVDEFLRHLQFFTADVELGQPIGETTSLKALLEEVLEIPIRSPIFDQTVTTICSLTDSDFESWVKQLDASRSVMQAHLENPKVWFPLGPDVPLERRVAFLRINDLP